LQIQFVHHRKHTTKTNLQTLFGKILAVYLLKYYKISKYTVRAKYLVFIVQAGDTYSKHCTLKPYMLIPKIADPRNKIIPIFRNKYLPSLESLGTITLIFRSRSNVQAHLTPKPSRNRENSWAEPPLSNIHPIIFSSIEKYNVTSKLK
jgi:hypothetical protein